MPREWGLKIVLCRLLMQSPEWLHHSGCSLGELLFARTVHWIEPIKWTASREEEKHHQDRSRPLSFTVSSARQSQLNACLRWREPELCNTLLPWYRSALVNRCFFSIRGGILHQFKWLTDCDVFFQVKIRCGVQLVSKALTMDDFAWNWIKWTLTNHKKSKQRNI